MRWLRAVSRTRILIAFLALVLVKAGFVVMSGYTGGQSAFSPYDAHAQDAATPSPATPAAPATESAPAQQRTKTPGPGELDLEIIRDVERRQKELDLQEEELKRKEERLAAMQADLDKQISELKALQARIDEKIELRDDLEKSAITKLAKTYAAMPPENAAALIQQIDPAIAIRVLAAMKERSAGRILALVPPGLASSLSEGLVKKK